MRCNGLKKNKTCCCVAGLVIKITGISIFSVACVTSDSVGLGGGGKKSKKKKEGVGKERKKTSLSETQTSVTTKWTSY